MPTVSTLAAMRLLARSERTRTDGELDADSLGFVGGTLNAIYIVILAFYVVFACIPWGRSACTCCGHLSW